MTKMLTETYLKVLAGITLTEEESEEYFKEKEDKTPSDSKSESDSDDEETEKESDKEDSDDEETEKESEDTEWKPKWEADDSDDTESSSESWEADDSDDTESSSESDSDKPKEQKSEWKPKWTEKSDNGSSTPKKSSGSSSSGNEYFNVPEEPKFDNYDIDSAEDPNGASGGENLIQYIGKGIYDDINRLRRMAGLSENDCSQEGQCKVVRHKKTGKLFYQYADGSRTPKE